MKVFRYGKRPGVAGGQARAPGARRPGATGTAQPVPPLIPCGTYPITDSTEPPKTPLNTFRTNPAK